MKWITNCHIRDKGALAWARSLPMEVIEGSPKGTEAFTSEELARMGMIGLYAPEEGDE